MKKKSEKYNLFLPKEAIKFLEKNNISINKLILDEIEINTIKHSVWEKKHYILKQHIITLKFFATTLEEEAKNK